MKKKMKQTIENSSFWKTGTLALVGLVVGFSITPLFYTQSVSAKEDESSNVAEGCSGSSGNLTGYIETENLGSIYVSNESWDEDHPSNPSDTVFYVKYDTEHGTWSGEGWSEKVGWVDFDYDQNGHLARFVAPGEEYDRLHDNDDTNDEPVEWGNWKGVADLSNVSYNVQDGAFIGKGKDIDNNTGEGDADEPVGSGYWFFDNVSIQRPSCPESINLLLNQKSRLTKTDCPIRKQGVNIQWTSEGVEDCRSVEGPWEHKDRPETYTGTSVHPTADITEDNSPARFTIQCKGKYSGMDIVKSATARCGKNDECEGPDCSPCEGPDCPIIVPKFIEA